MSCPILNEWKRLMERYDDPLDQIFAIVAVSQHHGAEKKCPTNVIKGLESEISLAEREACPQMFFGLLVVAQLEVRQPQLLEFGGAERPSFDRLFGIPNRLSKIVEYSLRPADFCSTRSLPFQKRSR
jgi:hypothetical protein